MRNHPVLVLGGVAVAIAVKAAAGLKTAAVIMKSGALAAKGAAVLGKIFAGKTALVSRVLLHASQTYGVAHVAAFGVVATMTVGAVALMFEHTEHLIAALENKKTADALLAASALCSEIHGISGLGDFSGKLQQFVTEHGSNAATARAVLEDAQTLAGVLARRLVGETRS